MCARCSSASFTAPSNRADVKPQHLLVGLQRARHQCDWRNERTPRRSSGSQGREGQWLEGREASLTGHRPSRADASHADVGRGALEEEAWVVGATSSSSCSSLPFLARPSSSLRCPRGGRLDGSSSWACGPTGCGCELRRSRYFSSSSGLPFSWSSTTADDAQLMCYARSIHATALSV